MPKKKFNGEAANEKISLIYTEKADAIGGHNVARVPDGNGGYKEIKYTAIAHTDLEKTSTRPDCVWQGRQSDIKVIANNTKTEQHLRETKQPRDQGPRPSRW